MKANTFPVIAYRQWDAKRTFYVADLPRKVRLRDGRMIVKPGFADWGYTEDHTLAIPLSRYWWRRFRADVRYCGGVAQCMEVRP
jgi:hypothetical protein